MNRENASTSASPGTQHRAQAPDAGMSATAPADKATPKERYEFLIESMKEHYAGLIDFEFKQGAFLAAALGWFITSETARDFLKSHELARQSLIVLVLLMTILHVVWVWRFWNRSDSAFRQLVKLNYVGADYLDFLKLNKVPILSAASFVLIHSAATVVLCVLIATSAD